MKARAFATIELTNDDNAIKQPLVWSSPTTCDINGVVVGYWIIRMRIIIACIVFGSIERRISLTSLNPNLTRLLSSEGWGSVFRKLPWDSGFYLSLNCQCTIIASSWITMCVCKRVPPFRLQFRWWIAHMQNTRELFFLYIELLLVAVYKLHFYSSTSLFRPVFLSIFIPS